MYFSSLDIRSGYHHISIHSESRPKTTFICPYSKFHWKRGTYGFFHAPTVFLSTMFILFLNTGMTLFYIDDVIVYSKTEQEHITHLQKIFEKFCFAGLKLKPSRCDFFKLHIEYLEIQHQAQESTPLKQKVQAILNLAPLSNVTQVRHILRLVSYYLKFIPMFSVIASPITSLTKKYTLFVWTAVVKPPIMLLNTLLLITLYLFIQTQTKNTTCSLTHQIIHGQMY